MVIVLDIYSVCQLAFPTEDHNIPFSLHLKKKLLCTELNVHIFLLVSLRVLDKRFKFSSHVPLHCKYTVILRSENCRKE